MTEKYTTLCSCNAWVIYAQVIFMAAWYTVLPLLFFFTRSGVFLFYLWFWVFYRKSEFFLLWSNFRNVCCITVFSIQGYSSFTCVMGRVSRHYSWIGLGLTKLFEIECSTDWALTSHRPALWSFADVSRAACAWFWNAFMQMLWLRICSLFYRHIVTLKILNG